MRPLSRAPSSWESELLLLPLPRDCLRVARREEEANAKSVFLYESIPLPRCQCRR